MGGVSILLHLPGFLKSGQLVTGSTSLLYKGSDGTGRSLNPDNYQPKGNYASASHNHTGVYQPVGSYATTTELNEVKTSVSNGKSAVASAITDKGVSTSATASFSTMASNIRKIDTSLPTVTLPAGYTQCSYIQTDGNAWVNTGIDLSTYTSQLVEVYLTSSWPYSSSINQKPLLNATNDSSQNCFYISQSTSVNTYDTRQYSYFYCGNQHGYDNSRYTISGNKVNYYIGISRSTISQGLPCRYGTKEAWSGSNTASSYALYKAIVLLWASGYNKASGTSGGAYPGSKIYEFSLYYNGSLVSHMIPCRSSAGVPGFYDVTRKAFYGNSGTGSLTYG